MANPSRHTQAETEGGNSKTDTLTQSVTVSSTDNTMMFVVVFAQDVASQTCSVTFDGTSMTSAGSATGTADNWVFAFQLAAPDATTGDVVATLGTAAYCSMHVVVYTNHHQTTGPSWELRGDDGSATTGGPTIINNGAYSYSAISIFPGGSTDAITEDADQTQIGSEMSPGNTPTSFQGYSLASEELGSDTDHSYSWTNASPWAVAYVEMVAEPSVPDIVTESIGATGRDYADIATWEAATDNNLVTANEVRIGEMYDDADFSSASSVLLFGGTTDATRFRRLTVAAGEEYDPITDTGVWITSSATTALRPIENFMEVVGPMGIEVTNAAAIGPVFLPGGSSTGGGLLDKLFILDDGTGASDGDGRGILTRINVTITNVIVAAPGAGATDAIINGIISDASSPTVTCYNCTVYNCNGNGFDNSSGTWTCVNCVATDNGTDYSGTIGGNNNASSDSTAPGTSPLTSITASNNFNAAGSNDFRVKNTVCDIYDAGSEETGTLTDDFTGTTRITWDIGAYEFVAIAAIQAVVATPQLSLPPFEHFAGVGY